MELRSSDAPKIPMPGLLVGDAVNTICILEMECLAQDQAGRVRVATAENKAAAAKVELEALQRAVVQEQKQNRASLQRHEREVSRKIRQAESRAQAEELKLQHAERALCSAKFELDSLRRKACAVGSMLDSCWIHAAASVSKGDKKPIKSARLACTKSPTNPKSDAK
eukprot:symbB.v1.2.017012.t1/scaffold1316.1/size125546/2